jgi:apolipoprotein N-acyltransferase
MNKNLVNKELVLSCVVALVSALLLIFSFPPQQFSDLAWISIIPIIIYSRFKSPKASFLTAFLCGFIFFSTQLFWINNLLNHNFVKFWVILGWFLLSAYCALYYGAFGWLLSNFCKYVDDKIKENNILTITAHNIAIILGATIFWTGLEYIRAFLFTGFPWDLLGISQYQNLSIIQIADVFGVYGISALIVIMNAGLSFVFLRFFAIYTKKKRTKIQLELIFVLMFLMFSWNYGSRAMLKLRHQENYEKFVISTVQPDIAQIEKWDPQEVYNVLETLKNQTELATQSSPDLIVWPETVLPSPVNYDMYMKNFVTSIIMTNKVPIFLGSIEVKSETFNTKTQEYDYEICNSAFMFNTNDFSDVYRKNHLVIFGEYIPLENLIKPLKKISPLGFSCSPGKENIVFEMPGESQVKFSALICFEDIFPALASRIAKSDSDFIVNLTNDGWFDGTSLPLQHFAHSIFRAIETRMPFVRSTNSGITAFVKPDGTFEILENDIGQFKFRGFKTAAINIADIEQTTYTKFGNKLLAIPAMCISILFAIFFFIKNKRCRAGDASGNK